MTWIAGVDPGKQGGWAVFHRETKELQRAGRVKFDDPVDFYESLHHCDEVIIERAQASAQMGASSVFEYGRGFGRLEACLMIRDIKIYYVGSQWWKGKLGVATDKKKAVQQAIVRIPGLSKYVKLASDDGVAEAALIAQILLNPNLTAQLIANNEKREKPKRKKISYRL